MAGEARQGRVLALYHLKGGVGKTTAAVNLAYLSAASGLKTLICDLDPQSSTTYFFRVKPALKNARKVLLKGGTRVADNIKGTDYEGLDLLPADWSHRHLPSLLGRVKKSRRRLRGVLDPFRGEYDLIILDSPATATVLAECIFVAADMLLVPVVPSTLAARAYANLRLFLRRKDYDEAKVWAFFSMVEARKKLHRATMQAMREQFPQWLPAAIPYNVDVESMGLARAPLPVRSPRGAATRCFRELWEQVAGRMDGGDPETDASARSVPVREIPQ
ncbi:MAG: AAA family ATPase [Deltaproteobacteria bacterium]|nr:AAA family ATPase [Deltaproteobacteria bacterium]